MRSTDPRPMGTGPAAPATDNRASVGIRFQLVAAALCLATVGIIVVANRDCAPKYFQRGDVIALLVIALLDAAVLIGSARRDGDAQRLAGAIASVSAGALFLSTFSVPAIGAPIAFLGAILRLPRSGAARFALAPLVAVAIVATAALPFIGQSFVSAKQFICP